MTTLPDRPNTGLLVIDVQNGGTVQGEINAQHKSQLMLELVKIWFTAAENGGGRLYANGHLFAQSLLRISQRLLVDLL